jgi:hypothetical protein
MLDLDAIEARAEAATLAKLGNAVEFLPGYWVTELGRVFSAGTNWRGYGLRQLKAIPNSHGYLRVRVVKPYGVRTSVFVHKLVAEHFVGPRPSPAHEVRHLNGDQVDNRAKNLAWGTQQDNADDRERHGRTARGEHNGFAKLTTKQVRVIRYASAMGSSQRDIARRVGVSQRTVGRVLHKETWASVEA